MNTANIRPYPHWGRRIATKKSATRAGIFAMVRSQVKIMVKPIISMMALEEISVRLSALITLAGVNSRYTTKPRKREYSTAIPADSLAVQMPKLINTIMICIIPL
jgi:hypothetical protein